MCTDSVDFPKKVQTWLLALTVATVLGDERARARTAPPEGDISGLAALLGLVRSPGCYVVVAGPCAPSPGSLAVLGAQLWSLAQGRHPLVRDVFLPFLRAFRPAAHSKVPFPLGSFFPAFALSKIFSALRSSSASGAACPGVRPVGRLDLAVWRGGVPCFCPRGAILFCVLKTGLLRPPPLLGSAAAGCFSTSVGWGPLVPRNAFFRFSLSTFL